MKIKLENQHVAVVGAFSSYNTAESLCRALMNHGASGTSRKIVTATTLVVEGKAQERYYRNKSVLLANARGVPVLDEEQVKALLDAGELDLADAGPLAGGDEDVSELVAEARSLLDGPTTSAVWSGVIALVDECDPDQLDELVAYLKPQLERREVGRFDRWVPAEDDPVRQTADSDFFRFLLRGVLRVAPPSWTMAGVEEDSPRLGLVEALSARELKLETKQLLALLGRGSLTGLRSLDLDGSRVTKTFWKKAPTLPAFQQLEQLRFQLKSKGDFASVFEAAPELPNLTKLFVDYGKHMDDEPYSALLRSPMTAHVSTLSIGHEDNINGIYHGGPHRETPFLVEALRDGALPALREVELYDYSLYALVEEFVKHPELLEWVETLSLVAPDRYTTVPLLGLSRLDFNGLGELDLTGINAEHRLLGRDDSIEYNRAQALEHLPGSRLVETVERLRLGDISSPELVDALDGQVELVG